MKKIKKLLSLWVLFILLIGTLFATASCMKIDEKTKWYSEKSLATTGLENLPKPNFEYKDYDGIEYSIDGRINEDIFHTYAQQLLDYMDGKYERFGTGGEVISNPTSLSGIYRYVECERELENYRYETQKEDGTIESIHYLFVYFWEGHNPTEDTTRWKIEITYWLEEQANRIQDDKGNVEIRYTYNFRIALSRFGDDREYRDVDKSIAESYERQNPDSGKASVLHYYNRNNHNDHFAVMITATNVDYGQAQWTENVGEYTFHYPDGNRILVSNNYYGGTLFYTLTERYEAGWLDDSELKNIERQHREFYPELYEIQQDYKKC